MILIEKIASRLLKKDNSTLSRKIIREWVCYVLFFVSNIIIVTYIEKYKIC